MLIKMKLLELGKKQVDLLEELKKRGYNKIYPSELSLMLSGSLTTPKSEGVIDCCYEIINEWERRGDT